MRGFAAGELDVLVATTVIEVGVDVPNATVMVVLDADRFGVSQLHQLRGRVGRGSAPGLCLLVTDAPAGTPARERLDAVASTTGRLRAGRARPGAAPGGRRARRGAVRPVARSSCSRWSRDRDLITDARAEATAIVDADPDLADHPGLAAAVATLVESERAEFLEKT